MMTTEPGLLDSNILVYALNRRASQHEAARQLRDQAFRGVRPACLCPQVLREFYAVVTHPRRIEDPVPPALAAEEVRKYLSTPVRLLSPGRRDLLILADLLARYDVIGQAVHDAALVATMLASSVRIIYTANTGDFAAYEEIEVVNPFEA
jgi:toxin-antitoxin system PIN domain toxin